MATVIPAQSPGLATARQVPRAPLPTTGVTFCCVMSCTTSEGTTPPSSLLLAHAPDQDPLIVFGCPYPDESLSASGGPPAPAGNWPFPTLSLQSLYGRLDPYPAASLWYVYSFLPKEQRPHLRRDRFGTLNEPCNATSTGGPFSGLQSFLYVQAPILVRPPGCTHR